MVTQPVVDEWVMLSYRIPREPSTPRIAVWRRLKDLGVVQLGDGLVALPKTQRTKERLEWVSAQVLEADGEAIVWVATPSTRRDTNRLVDELNEARGAEYRLLLDEIEQSESADARTIARWRRELRRIDRRDYLGAEHGDAVRLAIGDLANTATGRATAADDASAATP